MKSLNIKTLIITTAILSSSAAIAITPPPPPYPPQQVAVYVTNQTNTDIGWNYNDFGSNCSAAPAQGLIEPGEKNYLISNVTCGLLAKGEFALAGLARIYAGWGLCSVTQQNGDFKISASQNAGVCTIVIANKAN